MTSSDVPSKSLFDDDDDEDDLFKSAIEQQQQQQQHDKMDMFKSAIGPQEHHEDDEEESGYNTVGESPPPVSAGDNSAPVRSDTLDDMRATTPDEVEPEKSKEPEPEKVKEDLADVDLDGEDERREDEEEEENPFQNAHLNPELQLHSEKPEFRTNMNGGEPSKTNATPTFNEYDREEKKEIEGNDDFIQISISNPHRLGDGMSSYVVYDVYTKTNVSFFKRQEMKTVRRFSDFLGLHDKLSEKYLQNGRVIPPAPDKSLVGMTKVKLGGAADKKDEPAHESLSSSASASSASTDEFLERRRAALERFLNRVAAHPSLRTDPDFRDFLELDADLPKANQTAALSGKSVMKLISKVGEKMSNMTIKMEETDEWFEEKTHAMDRLESQLRKLHLSAETMFEYRRALGVNTGYVAKSLTNLSTSETNPDLSSALAKLSSVQEQIERVHGEQAMADFYQLSELIRDYIGLVSAVKDAFQERVKAWQNWQHATSVLAKKREAKVKAELQIRTERIGTLRQEIAESERQQEMAQENFERISRLIKKEVEMFEVQRAKDFKKAIISYMESMLKAQEKLAAEWERYLPQIQHVNHN